MTGESYAGQYVPNIAHFILNTEPFKTNINLAGLALGNACWGGNATHVECNGPNSRQNMADIYYGKGLSSKELYNEIYATCQWPNVDSAGCSALLGKQSEQVGPHNIYDIYDNCPRGGEWMIANGVNMYQVQVALEAELNTGTPATSTLASLTGKEHLLGATNPTGGYPWSCGGMDATKTWIQSPGPCLMLRLCVCACAL